MSVPTIASITPSFGMTAGNTLVEIVGTGFKVPGDPPTGAPVPPFPDTVAVTFGGVAALSVRVLSGTLLTALTPAANAGVVDVRLANLNADGSEVTGENVTKTNGYTFKRPVLAREVAAGVVVNAHEPIFSRVARALITAMRRAIVDNVVTMVHTEFDDVPGGVEVAMLASLPGLVLSGPELTENRESDNNETDETEDDDATFHETRYSTTWDLRFGITGAADSQFQCAQLLDAARDFFDRTIRLMIDRDPSDATAGTVSYELRVPLSPSWRITSAPNEANVRTFTGACEVLGVRREGAAGVDGDLLSVRGGRTTDEGATLEIERTED